MVPAHSVKRAALRVAIALGTAFVSMVPSSAFARDIVKDVIFSTLPPAVTELQKNGQKRISELIDRIAEIPDEEIPEFPIATNEYQVGMGFKLLESDSFCEQARADFMTNGPEIIAAQMTNGFMVAVAEGTKLTDIDPMAEETVPTQEMILAHRIISKMYGCM